MQDGMLQYQEHVSQLAQLGDQASAAQHELQRQVCLLNTRCCLTTVPACSAASLRTLQHQLGAAACSTSGTAEQGCLQHARQ